MLDLLIRGGSVIDGSGAARRTADVGIVDGRVAAVGRLSDAARHTIDADGLIVAPGFIDGHTHMDAQVMWDPLGTSSCYNGVTSVVSWATIGLLMVATFVVGGRAHARWEQRSAAQG